jgi:hypothetical protein
MCERVNTSHDTSHENPGSLIFSDFLTSQNFLRCSLQFKVRIRNRGLLQVTSSAWRGQDRKIHITT